MNRLGYFLFRAFVAFFSLGLCALAANHAADHSQISDSPRFSDDTAAFYRAASSVSPSAGADVLVLEDDESFVFDAQGRAVDTKYLVYKILTQKGVDGWDNVSLNWEPWHEDRPAIRARVITPDNLSHPIDPKTITDAPASDDEDSVYNDRRVIRAPLPAVAPGSLIEEEETSSEKSPVFDNGIVTRHYIGRFVSVQHSRLSVDAPTSLPIRFTSQLLPDLKPARTESNGIVHLVFELGPQDALESADPDIPSDVAPYPEVMFSTGNSWQLVAEDYAKIVDHQIAGADVKSIVAGLIKGKQSREEKASAILQYIDAEVRYTGVEFGDAAITPRTPAETLKRRFGDCKDKAALLVAMLRAAEIPSFVALLNAGDRQDVPVDLPGMGLFDHAIVYAPGSPDLWIDATDEYARIGELPAADQGRRALIARADSSALILSPVSSSRDNLILEKREIHLAENGPARVVEISEPHGSTESSYRSDYGNSENKDRKKELTDYMKSQYLADSLDRDDHSDPDDISRQFTLTLESNRAKRGATDLDLAAAGIRFDTLFTRLPSDLQQREAPEDKSSAAPKDKPKKIRTLDFQLSEAFVTEWHYEIFPPLGFRPKPLPANSKISLGPAELTQEFSVDPDGIVHATIRFDTVKSRFTVAEATELRNHVADLRAGQPILIYFEPIAQSLLEAGKVREAFQEYRRLIGIHPKEAVHHLQIAKALLAEGIGQGARDEAHLAVNLEPASALAQKTLADILEYDLIGRKLRPGSDYAGAEAAYRAAIKLDPDDHVIAANLAIFLEYNKDGERYAPGARMKDAAAEYLTLTSAQLAEIGVQNNPAFALFYAGQFDEAEKYSRNLNPQTSAVIVASEAVLHGAPAAITEATKSAGSEDQRKEILRVSGEMLMRSRKYSLAADLMDAGAAGDNATKTVALATLLRKARPREDIHYPSDPAGTSMQVFLDMTAPGFTLEKMYAMLSRNALIVTRETDKDQLDLNLRKAREVRTLLSRSGFPADIMLDVVMQAMEPKVEGDDSSGYRVTIRAAGAPNSVMYLVKEDGSYKLLDTSQDPNSIGLEILDRIAANNLPGARVLLDWLREEQHLGGGDDPLSGAAFPRMWTKGRDATPDQMKLAAAAILVQTKPTARQGVSILEPALASATSDTDKVNISLALITGYRFLDEFEKILALSGGLAKQYPESEREFLDQDFALRGLARFQEADAMAQDRLKRIPGDLTAQRAIASHAADRGDYALARELELKIANSEKGDSSDLNGVAWNSLFTGKTSDQDLADIIKADQQSQNNTAIMHTLGCVYAELGKTKQAYDVLIQAMDLLDLQEPESNYWYAFGRIAEQAGEDDVARADYSRAEKPKRPIEIPSSSYLLAQLRLKAMSAQAPVPPAPLSKNY